MALLGADTDELREVGQEFEQGKEVVDDVIMFLRALIAILRAASFFSGGASLAYAEYLETTVVPWLQKISQALGLFAKVLSSQAQAQDDTSDGSTVDFGSLPSYTSPALPAALKPYQGAPIAGGPADGAVTAGTTGSTLSGATTATPPTTSGIVPDSRTSPALTAATAAHGGSLGTSSLGTSSLGSGTSGSGTTPSTTHSSDVPATTLGGRTPDSGALSGGSGGGSGAAAPLAHSGSGSGSGSALGGGGIGDPGSLGSGAIHTSTPVDGGLGGSTPGSGTLGQLAAGAHPTSGSAVGAVALGAAASGAAALGVGGAALAARAGAGSSIDALASKNGRGSSGPEVEQLQEQLTAAGYDTHGTDGRWGGDTQRAYDAYRADHPLEIRQGTGHTSPDGYDYSSITGIGNTTPEFLRAVEGMSQRLGARPEHLLAAMSFETGGAFSADARNPHSSATGLIQFMHATAAGMGTTTTALAAMTPVEQLGYVERYLEPFRGRLGDLDSVYSSILAGHPASGDTSLFTQGTAAYAANAPLDGNHDGRITAAEAAARVRTRLGPGTP